MKLSAPEFAADASVESTTPPKAPTLDAASIQALTAKAGPMPWGKILIGGAFLGYGWWLVFRRW